VQENGRVPSAHLIRVAHPDTPDPLADEVALLAAVAQQPVVAIMHGMSSAFQLYSDGVISQSDCIEETDVTVLVVGT